MPSVKISFTPSQKRVMVKVVDQDKVLASFRLKAKKTLDGNIIIMITLILILFCDLNKKRL